MRLDWRVWHQRLRNCKQCMPPHRDAVYVRCSTSNNNDTCCCITMHTWQHLRTCVLLYSYFVSKLAHTWFSIAISKHANSWRRRCPSHLRCCNSTMLALRTMTTYCVKTSARNMHPHSFSSSKQTSTSSPPLGLKTCSHTCHHHLFARPKKRPHTYQPMPTFSHWFLVCGFFTGTRGRCCQLGALVCTKPCTMHFVRCTATL